MLSTILSTILIINEVMASNAGVAMSPATNFDSWIEIYNPTEQTVNLAGMYLSARAENLTYWQMPDDIGTVPAKGFLVVWMGSNDIKSNQAPFKLDCDGGSLFLSDQKGQLVTSINYPEAMSRTSWARKTDGGQEWGWTANATPGTTNATAKFATQRLDAPEVSVGSRLFQDPFTFEVTIPKGTTLMYTTDGSVPTSTTTTSTVRKSTDGRFTVSQKTNYVFRLFQEGYLPSVPVTRSYIKPDNDHHYTVPVVSIVGDERYFNDPMWGIYIVGQNGIVGNSDDNIPKNWNQPWDRPVNFSYISPTEGMLFNQDVNISISGGWTRSIDPRSVKLKSNKVFDGQNRFDYSFFPQKPYIRNKALVVRNGGNDVWSNHARFMDPALTTIIQRSGIDLDVQSTVQVVEYINGKFKGILNLREPNNDKFVYANWGYDDGEIDAFENGEFKNGTDEAYNRLHELSQNINEPGVYDEVRGLLDIDEFANYMAAELYLGNEDWPGNNVKAYRSQDDGRFRFVCFDLDYSFNVWDRYDFKDVLDKNKSVQMVSIFINLLKHDGFRRQFIDAYCIMAGSVFEKDRASAIVEELADAMRPMSQYDGYVPDNAANKIKNELKTRLEKMMGYLKKYEPMKLTSATAQNILLTSNTPGATLLVNGLKVPYSEFNGQLFAPVTLEAKAPAGYTFTGWRQSSRSVKKVLSNDATWRYYDQGSLQGANWYATTYGDTSWKQGQAPLGYKFSDIKTTVGYGPNAQDKYPTTYFRTTVDLSAEPRSSDVFELNYQLDDGFVIYVNGQEGGRVNMRSGNIDFKTYASDYAESIPISGTLSLPTKLFKKGKNVIAVEVHNNQAASSDLYWSCELLTSVGASVGEKFITDPVIQLSESDNNINLTANFTPLTEAERKAQGLTPVRINEVSADDGVYVNDYFKRNDWVELYNTTDQPIDVEGMFLTDNPDKPKKYQISKGESQASTIIPAHGYLVIWCDKLEPQSQLHASFKLDNEGDELQLMAADGSWTDRLVYTAHESDQTVGRYPDGSNQVYVMNIPTIAKTNIFSSFAVDVEQPVITGISEMAGEQLQGSEQTYNLKGQAVQGTLKPGIYIRNGKKFIVK